MARRQFRNLPHLVDVVSVDKRSQMMAGIKSKNTKPEILVRRLLHAAGFRFVLNRKDLPGKPDIVLPKWRVVVFVHGCFWHGHDNCPLFSLPKSKQEFWEEKIDRNKMRDNEVRRSYTVSEWRYIEIWECSLKGRTRLVPSEIQALLMSTIQNFDIVSQTIRGHKVA